MTIKFTATGKERKQLAQAVAATLNAELDYKGAPTFAYQAGFCTIDRESNLIIDDNVGTEEAEALIEDIVLQGFEVEPTGAPEDEPIGMEITVPIDENDTETFDKVQDIITSKQTLFKHAIGIERPVILRTENGIAFPWFTAEATADEVEAYSHLACKIVEMAKSQKRVIAKERPVDNEKYAFRCFLLRLGFIGSEYKAMRKVLLKNLSGSSAFKTAKEAE